MRCGPQFVGETGQPLHMKVSGHQYDIAHQKTEETPMAKHFNSREYVESEITVMFSEFAQSHDTCLDKLRESRWMRTLGTSSPLGMNFTVNSL